MHRNQSAFDSVLPGDVAFAINICTRSVSLLCIVLLGLMTACKVLHIPALFNFLLLNLTIGNLICLVADEQDIIGRKLFDVANDSSCHNTPECVLTAAFVSYGSLTAYAWTILIGWCCTLTIMDKLDVSRCFTSRTLYCVVAWGGCTVVPTAALIRKAYGKTNLTLMSGCWIRTCNTDMAWSEQVLWMMLTCKLWEFFSYFMITNILFVGLCLRNPRSLRDEFSWAVADPANFRPSIQSREISQDRLAAIQNVKLFLWIPVCLLLCRCWASVRFYIELNIFSHEKNEEIHTDPLNHLSPGTITADKVLEVMEAIFGGSQSTANFILVLIFREEARSWLCKHVRRLFCFLRTETSIPDERQILQTEEKS